MCLLGLGRDPCDEAWSEVGQDALWLGSGDSDMRGLKRNTVTGEEEGDGAAQACARVRPQPPRSPADGQCSPSSGLLREENVLRVLGLKGAQGRVQWSGFLGPCTFRPGPPQSFNCLYGASRPFPTESD